MNGPEMASILINGFGADGIRLTSSEKTRRRETQKKWRRAAGLRMRWTAEELALEEERLRREVVDMLEARRAA